MQPSLQSPGARAPIYKLYGEDQWPTPDMVHCESIAARSRLHDWQIRLHRHHGLMQWLYLRAGQARAALDGRFHDLPAGCIVAVPQMCAHGFQFAPDAQGYVVTLGYPLIKRLEQSLRGVVHLPGQPRVLRVEAADLAALDAAFSWLHTDYQAKREHRDGLIEAMLTSILVWLSRRLSEEAGSTATQPMDRARRHFAAFGDLIEANYLKPWSVAQYAAHIGVTPAHLNVLCRDIVGQSALMLIHQRRLLEAKRMLVYTSMTVSNVADALGFSDPAYFTRFFSRMAGMSPRAFRQQAASLIES
ncbi:helix-turn-helix domain-containing protein [Pusillimonas sp. CC-YST705]|uniref:Helix-turn-helix domain-containing protein n=1 Tax=Mesopusillimonas faecipullorum TaxID=2755040 RepID=A0ABS8CDI5_9BURK|nr:helix-turn-helix domain-containing protein [Mesopusillimonas faecipullorum]MCB5364063.1 helix-turn-helix domain-containing protein [Mesopusillimonas faecipullorum]